MRSKKPPFEITNTILDEIAEIAELVGHVNASFGLSTNPTLRRTNRIRTIYSSLAIEQNTLSLEQVTAVLNGKHVIASPKDIAEVKCIQDLRDHGFARSIFRGRSSARTWGYDQGTDRGIRMFPLTACGCSRQAGEYFAFRHAA